MSSKKRIIIAGFADATRDSDFQWFTRAPIADYINEIAQSFDECIWFVTHRDNRIGKTGLIDSDRVKVITFNPKLSHVLNNLFKLLRHINANTYFIFHLPTMLTLALASPLFSALSRKCFVYIGSDYEKVIADFHGKWFGWKTFYRLSHELSMSTAHCVIARGKYLSELAKKFNSHVVETVPIANISSGCLIQEKHLDDESSKHTLRILYMGKLRVSKGLGDLLYAFETLYQSIESNIDIELDIVGDGPDFEKFTQKAGNLNCSKHIHFYGWVEDQDKINSFFSSAQVLVVPSSTHPEGVPRVIDEALMRRVPVISTKIGGIEKEFSGNEVLLVEAANPSALANALEKILFDSETRDFYIQASRSRVMLWQRYGNAARQHLSLLFGENPVEEKSIHHASSI